jgi:hypothetical protein
MTNNKKIENEQIEETIQELVKPIGEIKLSEPKKMEQCEWCFQFDDDEPKVFAWTNEDMKDEDPTVTFTIGNTDGAYVSFTKDDKKFKLFARELSEEGIKLREYQNKLENESKNKEA